MSPALRQALRICAALALALAVLHAFGVRRSTSITAGVGGSPVNLVLAAVYVGTWFWSVLITPILVLAAALLGLDRRLNRSC